MTGFLDSEEEVPVSHTLTGDFDAYYEDGQLILERVSVSTHTAFDSVDYDGEEDDKDEDEEQTEYDSQ